MGSSVLIIGDLDLDWAEQDPGYLASVKAFLVSAPRAPAAWPEQPPPTGTGDANPDGTAPELGI